MLFKLLLFRGGHTIDSVGLWFLSCFKIHAMVRGTDRQYSELDGVFEDIFKFANDLGD